MKNDSSLLVSWGTWSIYYANGSPMFHDAALLHYGTVPYRLRGFARSVLGL